MVPTILVHTDLHAYPKMAEPTLTYGSKALLRVFVLVQVWVLPLQELPHTVDVVLPVEFPTCRLRS